MVMRPPIQTKPPTFFWQGLLILMPVAVLAGLGLLSLRQDRRLAEQDAQDRARELLRQLEPDLARSMGVELARFQLWARQWESERIAWLQSSQTNLPWSASWRTNYPALDPDQALFRPASLSPSGEPVEPRVVSCGSRFSPQGPG